MVEATMLGAFNELPMLRQGNIGAAKLALQKNGFALPRYSDASKVAYVLQGVGIAGIVLLEYEEKVIAIKKGDAIAITLVLSPGALIGNQQGKGIVKLDANVKMHVPKSDHHKGMALNCEEAPLATDIKNAGNVVLLNPKNLPLVGQVRLGADLVRLGGNAMCSPGFACDSALQEGNLLIVPRFFVVSKIADPDGLSWFSIITTPNIGARKAISPEVLQVAFNVPAETKKLFSPREPMMSSSSLHQTEETNLLISSCFRYTTFGALVERSGAMVNHTNAIKGLQKIAVHHEQLLTLLKLMRKNKNMKTRYRSVQTTIALPTPVVLQNGLKGLPRRTPHSENVVSSPSVIQPRGLSTAEA
ncbi:Tetratricopeptide repeat-like superfamily protein [Hibiscus syriacus]|uniref:Tetratricopeptide repeat-like superfamily protein n=1 Tax=Hibiscus syriacus TaxID=106335 RepID=A0A6A2ZEL5_HIBSY|nr:Tetratricopeptide repeat-like superfamily protein [Hibiscus syriacus]